ncbi:2-isopropylmalate synthase [candidate division KD3-62 bacterium DG_56]|uniref:2-isopropylmalate synthase n=1 Tax=candidate division KD3-62 bacterium DG_56 TaxID=1704032 RepID=A0A0S7XNS8_9BACT|nr:MAG: 2-isopropylmalate synthase [candidate division KD3-62 bacterium DG_56]
MRRIVIFDTTLRDGEQSPGASLNAEEKLEIGHQLARLGVDVIEAGFPMSSQGDFEAVCLVAQQVRGPAMAGLARAKPEDIDRAWEAVKDAKRARIHTFIATSDIHLKHKLKISRRRCLEMAVEAVKRARRYTDDVEFSAEDAVRSDRDFLCQVVEAVIEAGATTVNIPDTVGYGLPADFGALIAAIRDRVSNIDRAVISVHCHNDLGLGVANSLAAVLNGAGQVECTVNGLGERAGNAALEEVVMALKTRQDQFQVTTGIDTRQIYRTSRLVSELTGIPVQPNKAIVGTNAFAHEAGIHQHGVIEAKRTYEIMDATSIGLTDSQLVLGKHSGRHAFERRLKELGYELSADQLERAFARFKEIADIRKEVSDRELESIASDELHGVPEVYGLDYLHVVSGNHTVPSATIRLTKDGKPFQASEFGVGSVDAVYRTIDAIVKVDHSLVDYTVKAVTGGTDALGDVAVRISDRDGRIYAGRGTSPDVIEASAKAYVQAINKLVYHRSTRRRSAAKRKSRAK